MATQEIWTPECGAMTITYRHKGPVITNIVVRALPRFDAQAQSAIELYGVVDSTPGQVMYREILGSCSYLDISLSSGIRLLSPLDEDQKRHFRVIRPRPQINIGSEPVYSSYLYQMHINHDGNQTEQIQFRATIALASAKHRLLVPEIVELDRSGDASPEDYRKLFDYWVTAETVAGDF